MVWYFWLVLVVDKMRKENYSIIKSLICLLFQVGKMSDLGKLEDVFELLF